MAIHTYSPNSPARQRAAARQTLDHIAIHPTADRFTVLHHYRDQTGTPTGKPAKFEHDTVQGVQDHLAEHLQEPAAPGLESENAEAPTGGKRA